MRQAIRGQGAALATATRMPKVTVLEPPHGLAGAGFGELWQARELVVFLAWRDLKVRYAQTALGWAWAVLQPVLLMAVFTVFFGHLAHVPSDGKPYALFVLCGTVPWAFFASAAATAGESLTRNANLVSKVYFPRLIVPLAAVAAWFPDLLITSGLMAVVVLAYGIVPGWGIVFVPACLLLAAAAAAAVSVWAAALDVAYRDVRHAIPFVLQLGLFVTPVIYPASLAPHRWRWVLGLNPMAGIIETIRWGVLGTPRPGWPALVLAPIVIAVILVSGVLYFRRVERFFADLI